MVQPGKRGKITRESRGMRVFFSILSVAYIWAIFFLADAPVVHILSSFNPYSLLHIPLYGGLTLLLVFSMIPVKLRRSASTASDSQRLPSNRSSGPNTQQAKLLIPAFIAFGVAIADEIHQGFIPNRDASITDILLDVLGILIFLFAIRYVRLKAQSD